MGLFAVAIQDRSCRSTWVSSALGTEFRWRAERSCPSSDQRRRLRQNRWPNRMPRVILVPVASVMRTVMVVVVVVVVVVTVVVAVMVVVVVVVVVVVANDGWFAR
jgi:hypothetical protein